MMNERLRKFVYIIGSEVIIIMTPVYFIFAFVSAFFNISDAQAGSSKDLLGLVVYGIIVFLFFKLMKKPFGNEYSPMDRLRILLMYGFIVFILLLIIILAIVIVLYANG